MEYYVQNGKSDGIAKWWKQNNLGYVTNIHLARKFSEAEVSTMYSILRSDKVAWPVEYIDSFGTQQISVEMLADSMCWKKD